MNWLIDLIAGPLLPYVLAAGAALVSLMAYGRSKKKQGADEAETDALRDGAEKQEKGRNAVQDLRDADRDELDSQLRDNDSDWK